MIPKEVLGIIVKYNVEGRLNRLGKLRLVNRFWRDSIDKYIFYSDAEKVDLSRLIEKQKYRTVIHKNGFGNHAYRVEITGIESNLRYVVYSHIKFFTGTIVILFNYSRRIKNIKSHKDNDTTYHYKGEIKIIYDYGIKKTTTDSIIILWNNKPLYDLDWRYEIAHNLLISITKQL